MAVRATIRQIIDYKLAKNLDEVVDCRRFKTLNGSVAFLILLNTCSNQWHSYNLVEGPWPPGALGPACNLK